jgi:hypothetical protein
MGLLRRPWREDLVLESLDDFTIIISLCLDPGIFCSLLEGMEVMGVRWGCQSLGGPLIMPRGLRLWTVELTLSRA